MEIITVTGTKGKTTVARVLSSVIHETGRNTLRVDTDGHFINEKQKSDLNFSKNIFGNTVPTVSPGKYLIEMKKYYPDFTAVLEAALGSGGPAGLGYGRHKIGIFTNVYEDHLGVSKNLKTKKDIADLKKFVFSKIDNNGFAIFNADDYYVCSKLKTISARKNITKIPVGFDFKYFDIRSHIEKGGSYITYEKDNICLVNKHSKKKLLNVLDIAWTFGGMYKPSILNIMFVIGGLIGYGNGKISNNTINILKKVKLDKTGGRLTLLESSLGASVIIDFAHEKFSLIEISKLAKEITTSGHTILVFRLAPDRTNKMLMETGRAVANIFDDIIIYDKIDGVNRKSYISKSGKFDRKIGEVSSILFKSIKSVKKRGNTKRIIIEEDAIKYASDIHSKGDVAIIISGDNHINTVKWVKKYFKVK